MKQPLFRIPIAFFFIQFFGLSRAGVRGGQRWLRDVNLRDVLAISNSGDDVNQRQREPLKVAFSTNIYIRLKDYSDAASFPRQLFELKATSVLKGLHSEFLFKIENRNHVPKQITIQRVNDNTFRLVANAPLVISEEQERTGRFPILVEAVAKDNPSQKAVYKVNVNLEDIQQRNAERSTPMPKALPTRTGCFYDWKAGNHRDNNPKTCQRYFKEKWCTEEGALGPRWKDKWGSFTDYADANGNTARVCPQCGCGNDILTDKFIVPTQVDLSHFIDGYNQRLDKLSDQCNLNFRAFNEIKEDFTEMEGRTKELLEKKTQECADTELDLRAQLEEKQKELLKKEEQIAELQALLK